MAYQTGKETIDLYYFAQLLVHIQQSQMLRTTTPITLLTHCAFFSFHINFIDSKQFITLHRIVLTVPTQWQGVVFFPISITRPSFDFRSSVTFTKSSVLFASCS